MNLPPGQHAVDGFPRFGTHLNVPPPAVPVELVVEVSGAVGEPLTLRAADLGALPRREQIADLHCVAGWSAMDLRWEGVPFEALYRALIAPSVPAGVEVTHLVLVGLDRYRSVVTLGDALGDDVLVADHLNGRPLNGDHGAPLRLVSPSQYGFASTKHLCGIELHTSEPDENFGTAARGTQLAFKLPLFRRHPRARVWEEERHAYLPGRLLRTIYRALGPPIAYLSARGSRDEESER